MAGTQVFPTSPFGSGGGGTPASTVVTETSFGQASAVGTSTDYARADHTHGTPTAPTVSGWTDGGTAVYLDTTTDQVSIGSNTPVTNRKLSVINTGTNLGIGITPLASTDMLLESKISGAANVLWSCDSSGSMLWGPGGVTAPDINVYRSGSFALRFSGATAVSTYWDFFGTLKTVSRRRTFAAITTSTNISATASQYDVLLVDPTAGAITITLVGPSATVSGRHYTIKRTSSSANAVTIQGASGNIDGAATYVLAGGTLASVDVICDNTNWWVI